MTDVKNDNIKLMEKIASSMIPQQAISLTFIVLHYPSRSSVFTLLVNYLTKTNTVSLGSGSPADQQQALDGYLSQVCGTRGKRWITHSSSFLQLLSWHFALICSMKERLKALENELKNKDHQMAKKDLQIQDKDLQIEKKDLQLEDKDLQIKDKDLQIKSKDLQTEDLNKIVRRLEVETSDAFTVLVSQKPSPPIQTWGEHRSPPFRHAKANIIF